MYLQSLIRSTLLINYPHKMILLGLDSQNIKNNYVLPFHMFLYTVSLK